MRAEDHHPFSSKTVLQALVKAGMLSPVQARQIQSKKEAVRRRLEVDRKKASGAASIQQPVTIIDVILDLQLHRHDLPDQLLDEEAVYQALAKAWGFAYKKVDPLKLNLNLVTTTIPRSFAVRHAMLPIAVGDGQLTVATADPFNREAMEDIERATHMRIRPVVSARYEILKLIHEFFGFKRSIAAAENLFGESGVDLGNLEQYVRLQSSDELPSNDQHVVNAVNHLLGYAFDQRASDIHIEPKRNESLVRLRIDGVLHTVHRLPKTVHSAIVSRIKAMSRMDMAEKRRPQDGRIKTEKAGKEVEIRISTVPVAFGEKVVMRLMDPDILLQDLEELGFTDTDLIRYNQYIRMPHGIALVCGPTGSGKSTTLYSTLRDLYDPGVNVTTVEDPIEMVHEDFNQIAVQPKAGVTFGGILRNILRQDPDIIMIGEMRDLETAQNAVQAALTGHLVLSTLHTNDAPSSITRLLDIGIPHFLIQATLIGILAQRLVRLICPHCKESFPMDPRELRSMGLTVDAEETLTLFRGKGCQRCRGTGHLGRSAVFEVLPYTEALRKLTTEGADMAAIQHQARAEGMVTLRENAARKLLEGKTTYQEVLRVTWAQPHDA
ncbi:MAG: GspE/PulE family protein [Desulfobacteraceae bacterium]|nr:GspE/PulE family protein [Desulfobacteraceae bacterium]